MLIIKPSKINNHKIKFSIFARKSDYKFLISNILFTNSLKGKFIFVLFISLAFLFDSCRITRSVPEDEYLLQTYKIKTDSRLIDREEMTGYVRQKPNKEILGFKFYLALYNLARDDKNNWFNNSLRTVGEEPVIYDSLLTQRTVSQLELYLRNKGFYYANVSDTSFFHNKKANVVYRVEANKPYRISAITYQFEDSTIQQPVLSDTVNTLLKKGDLFDEDVLASERERIEQTLLSKGYYNFTREYVFYKADTISSTRKVDLTVVIKAYHEYDENGSFVDVPHPKYRIRKVLIYTNYKPREVLGGNQAYLDNLHTIEIDSISIKYLDKQNVKPGIILESNYIQPGDLYDVTNVKRSYRNLNSLRIFRLVTIEFKPVIPDEPDSTGTSNSTRLLDCSIMLTTQTLQSFTVELEGTNSSGNIGAAGNLIFQHRNLFRNAENLDVRFTGAIETIKESNSSAYGNLIEYGSEIRFNIPKFLLPFKTDQFIKKFNPATAISLAYNYQQRPDYTRTLANASFGYNWRGNKFLSHVINPIELNLVKIPYKSPEFTRWLEGKYIAYSYQPHLVTVSSYSLVFNNQNLKKKTDFSYLRFNIESAGNLLYSAYRIAGATKENGSYKLFNTDFAQYLKGDIDLRYYNIFDEKSSLVYRVFAGAGVPYKNSEALPFEKKYFSGGANSIRAWQVRNLGPGSYIEKDAESLYPNKTADIKLEANLEYRFKLFWILEGAFFLDAGNIWAINSSDEREGALFEWNRFYKEIALGTGFGTRFVFSFFTFRVDLGLKLRDPAGLENNRWIIGNRGFRGDDFTVNIGIGYPF